MVNLSHKRFKYITRHDLPRIDLHHNKTAKCQHVSRFYMKVEINAIATAANEPAGLIEATLNTLSFWLRSQSLLQSVLPCTGPHSLNFLHPLGLPWLALSQADWTWVIH